MKVSVFLLAAVCTSVLAVSTTAWPFFWPPHHPFLPFPIPHHGGAFPPSSSHGGFPSLPPSEDIEKCMQSVHDSGAMSCLPLGYDAGKCCTHLKGLGDSCTYMPYYKSSTFQSILKLACNGGSPSKPSPPSKS